MILLYGSALSNFSGCKALNPDRDNLPPLDPKDAFLVTDPGSSSGPFINGPSSSNIPATPTHVPWLRKTEYLSKEGVLKTPGHESYVASLVVPLYSVLKRPQETGNVHPH